LLLLIGSTGTVPVPPVTNRDSKERYSVLYTTVQYATGGLTVERVLYQVLSILYCRNGEKLGTRNNRRQ